MRQLELNDTVRDVAKIVAPEVEKRGIVLRTLLSSEALPVRCDPIHLQQVMINLVTNAMDAMDGEQRPHNLTVRTRQDAEGVEVRISDSGKGIPKDSLASIFDAFFTTKPQGTGLGLPIGAYNSRKLRRRDLGRESPARRGVFVQAPVGEDERGVR